MDRRDNDLSSELAALEGIGTVARPALDRLAQAGSVIDLTAGEPLIDAGGDDVDVSILLAGQLEVLAPDGARVAGVEPGAMVGERALLAGEPRNAAVRAGRDSRVLRVPGDAFLEVFESEVSLARYVSTLVARRVVASPEASARPVSLVAVVAATGCPPATAAEVARRLAEAVGGNVVVNDLVGADDEALARGVREADRIALVAGPDPPAAPGAVEASIEQHRRWADIHLLLTGGGAAVWLADRPVAAWHHLDADVTIGRAARHLTDRAVVLVLGGGGARAGAHMGVLRALEEAGVVIDAIGGASMGAVAAAAVAIGWGDAEREAKSQAVLGNPWKVLGLTLPLVALSSGRKITRMLRDPDLFGESDIEDLPLPFFCVSANFSLGGIVVHDRGPLWWALRATTALPGVLPPVFHEGDLLVDGGVVNMLPTDVARRRWPGPIVAVNLRAPRTPRVHEPFGPSVSGWRVLGSRLRPGRRGRRLPGPISTLLRSKELAGKDGHRVRLAAADLLLQPPTLDVGELDFPKASKLVEPAYQYTSELIAALEVDQPDLVRRLRGAT